VALVCGYVIGFRFHRGPVYVAAFCLLVLLTAWHWRSWQIPSAPTREIPLQRPRSGLPVAAADFWIPVGGIPTAAAFSRVDTADRPQSAHLPLVYAMQALAGDTAEGK
jgi:ABC-2 type transport system permease protein